MNIVDCPFIHNLWTFYPLWKEKMSNTFPKKIMKCPYPSRVIMRWLGPSCSYLMSLCLQDERLIPNCKENVFISGFHHGCNGSRNFNRYLLFSNRQHISMFVHIISHIRTSYSQCNSFHEIVVQFEFTIQYNNVGIFT